MSVAPLYEHLCAFAKKEKISFHMPGHKNGKAFSDYDGADLFALDVTELSGLDNLLMPSGIIAQAEALAAKAFFADRTHFLVGGSTCGILAMIYATVGTGERVIVDRGCHESVFNAIRLCGATAIFVSPELNSAFGLPMGVQCKTVLEAFSKFDNIKAVIITSPNYYGMVSDICAIAEIAHKNGALLLVDEAHGAAFSFSEKLPAPAILSGADIAVQSMHKTLPAPGQTALLHIREERVASEDIKRAINMFQTSSPSYLLMAYMDLCRAIMEDSGAALDAIIDFVNEKKRISPLHILATDDPLRLVVNTNSQGMSGFGASKYLIDQFGIYVEAADLNNIICIINQYNTKAEIEKLFWAVEGIGEIRNTDSIKMPQLKDLAEVSPIDAFDCEWAAISKSVGRICADTITAYPPCVPIVVRGERINSTQTEYIMRITEEGGEVRGLRDGMVLVAKESVE